MLKVLSGLRYHSWPGRRAPALPHRVWVAGTAVERLMGILYPLGLPIPGHLQPDVDSAHPVIDLPVAEILKYIAADARREGVGRALLDAVSSWAASERAERIQLEVRAGNLGAIRFYERAGLINEGVRRGYYRDPEEDAVLMGKGLYSSY